MNTDSIRIGNRQFTLDDLVDKVALVNTAGADAQAKAAVGVELTALNLFAALCSASALSTIAATLLRMEKGIDQAIFDAQGPEAPVNDPTQSHPAGVTIQQMKESALHDNLTFSNLRLRVVERGIPQIFEATNGSKLKVFLALHEHRPVWSYTLDGKTITEEAALAVIEGSQK